MNTWMGALFFRNQPIDIIRSMRFAEMKYWHGWHESIEKTERNAFERAKAGL